ncbi:diaminopropionate ammonia-lyase [Brachyspira sp.]|uniref:diaminopropionate ammonia-lyase n=1 Tax=Brachyspira sp. TaxID=1977261 RepID=UPI00262C136E|nr:diaminopropionate ammonia-lyase [Brachyspira sp.]
MSDLKWAENNMPKSDDKNLPIMSIEEVKKAKAFHQSFPQYAQTPLSELKEMSKYLGLGTIKVKDESYRFGLNAFKVLGGSYSMARYIAQKMGKDVSEFTYDVLTSQKLKDEFGQATFFSATDGNHGRGVAWAANKLGQKSVIFMPKGSTQTRLKNIQAEGATATIEEFNYDDCVRKAAAEATKVQNGVVVQDTAWEGYEEIPAWIMQGYGTMALEADEQFGERPTHVFVQAGVGSLAGAMVGYFSNKYKDNPPIMIVVEADAAACLYKGAEAGDGKIRIVDGDLDTIMAGLACGEPNITSWDILKNHANCFIAAQDIVAARGMRMLSAPLKGDPQVVSGESGAAPFGALATIMLNDEYAELRKKLKLDSNSKVLLFSTEGDTDPARWKNIIWEAKER